MIDTGFQDLRHAVRALVKRPVLAVPAVITLTLGIGASITVFSVVNAVLLQAVPYPNADRLVYVWTSEPSRNIDRGATSVPDFLEWESGNRVFEQIAAVTTGGRTLTGGDEAEHVQTATVSASLFPLLGVGATRGRTFLPEEERWGQHQVVVLSDGLWQRRFGGDPRIIGTQIQLDGLAFRVIGIAPPHFDFPSPQIDVWTPMSFPPNHGARQSRNTRFLSQVVARLETDVTLDEANQDMEGLAAGIAAAHPETSGGVTVTVEGMAQGNTQAVRVALLLLMGAVGLVLLIACINVANLLLAHAVTRNREMAVRTALGASRGRVIRQLLTESGVLAVTGCGFGLLLAHWWTEAVVRFAPATLPGLERAGVDGLVVIFALCVAFISTLLSGLLPAVRASQAFPQSSLREARRGTSSGRSGRRMFHVLVVSELALAVVLLVGATLLIRSFAQVQAVDPGFNPQSLAAVQVRLPASKYEGRAAQFFTELLESVRTLPGVKAAGAGSLTALPLGGSAQTTTFGLEHEPVPSREEDKQRVYWRQITPGYFRALGIPLLKGRLFSDRDHPNSPAVAIVNEALVRRFFSDADPIGKGVWIDDELRLPLTVVGVVGDAKFFGLENPDEPAVYTSHPQEAYFVWSSMWVVVRAQSDPTPVLGMIRDQIKRLDTDVPVARVATMSEMMGQTVADRRLNMLLLAMLAAIAFGLATLGIYGVMAHSVGQRTAEMGVRAALGATGTNLVRLAMGQGAALAAIGIALGLVGSLATVRWLKNLLFGVTAFDPLTFVAVPIVLGLVGLLACYIPASRAARVDPVTALRQE